MSFTRRAVIDIGTNSVKLLVADATGRQVDPVREDSEQTRLGEGFYEAHILQPGPITKTAAAVKRFADLARQDGAQSVRVIATSAARDAKNSQALISAVNEAAGLTIEIISGEQEADWAYQGVTTDAELARQPLLLLDVGGGSTEFILGHGNHRDLQHSFLLGTVRLLERFPHSDPPTAEEFAACREWLRHFLQTVVRPIIEKELPGPFEPHRQGVQLVGTGGTATLLARMQAGMTDYERARIEATRLSTAQVRARAESLWRQTLAARRTIVGLPAQRADVILTGVAIYEAVMAEFGFAELRVSTRGLRFAALMDGADAGRA